MSTTNKIIDYSAGLELYRQSGDICNFLNITVQIPVTGMENELSDKFDALEAAGFMLSPNSILELLFPSILRQFTVAKCSFEQQLSAFKSDMVKNYFVDMEAKGVGSTLLPMLIMPSAVSLLAVLFNLSLLVVTVKNIPMATGCNWLLAFDSCCQIPAQLPFLVNLFAVCARLEYVDYQVCLVAQMLSTGSLYASFLAVYCMSLERLLVMVMPIRMSHLTAKRIKHWSLLSCLCCVCLGVAMLLNIASVIQSSINSSTNAAFGSYVYCNTWFYGHSLSMYNSNWPSSHTILGLAVLNYVIMAGVIFWRRVFLPNIQPNSNSNDAYSHATMRMLRAVFIISIILVIGWLTGSLFFNEIEGTITMLSGNMGRAWFVDSQQEAETFGYNLYSWALGLITCLFPMAAGINAPVLIINNSVYRNAYKKTLASILPKRTPPNSIGPLIISNHHLLDL